MKILKSYIKKYIVWIVIVISIILVQDILFALSNGTTENIIYSLVLSLSIMVIAVSVHLYIYVRRYNNLMQISSQVSIMQNDLPIPCDLLEETYQNIISQISNEKISVINAAQRQSQDMQEYYSIWVHQIKTPIAAMELLLQVQNKEMMNPYLKDFGEELFKIEQYVDMAFGYQRINSTVNDFVLKK